MTITINHKFVSAKGDGTDNTLVRPSNWNDTHTIQCATGVVLGRQTAGSGAAEEIPLTAYMASLLNTADFATLAAALGLPSTGDGKLTLKTSADSGWVMMNDGTIGSATSNASTRANNDCQALFTLLYNNVSDTNAPLYTLAGSNTTRVAQGTASVAWAAGCKVQLTRQLGRAIVIAGAGASLTSRNLGDFGGSESTTLITANLPPYTPQGSNSSSPVTVTSTRGDVNFGLQAFNVGTNGSTYWPVTSGSLTSTGTAGAQTFTGTPQGGTSTPFTNMQPFTAWNIMVKL